MPEPYEIIVAPYDVYWGPVGEAFPAIDAVPAGNWKLIGKVGAENYAEEGVTVAHSQTIEKVRPAGSTGARKANRTAEDQMIRVIMWDMRLEQYRLAMNNNSVSTTAAGSGTAGYKTLGMYRGLSVSLMSLLVRGNVSPEGDGWKTQYEVPVCFQSGSPEPVYRKGTPAGLALEFDALVDPNAASEDERFGRLKVQHQAPLA